MASKGLVFVCSRMVMSRVARTAPLNFLQPLFFKPSFQAPKFSRPATLGAEGSDADFAPKSKPTATSRDIGSEIKQMVTSRKVLIFMKGTPDFPMCGFSNRAVQILDQHKTSYGAFNVLDDAEIREGVKKFSNWPTIPQLYIQGEFIGGCDIMMELNSSGELKKLLADAGAITK